MTIPVLQAAKQLCSESKWTLSNLELQKIIYITHMVYLGTHSEQLVFGDFQAWRYGPVHPELYHFLKRYGAKPINNELGIFNFFEDLSDGNEKDALNAAVDAFPAGSGPKLVAITHWEKGAWTKLYRGGDLISSFQRRKFLRNSKLVKHGSRQTT